MILRAFLAALVATIIGAELIGLYLAVALSASSEHANSIALVLTMFVGAPFLAAPWVIPSATVAATLLAPLALRIAPFKTAKGFFRLAVLGALVGFALLFLFGLAITVYFNVDYPQSPLVVALRLSWIYGPVFGALTAVGWWWQLPQPTVPLDRPVDA